MSSNNKTISGTRSKAIKESVDLTKKDIGDLRSNVLSKATPVEPLSEEEAIEAEMDRSYNQKTQSFKRKFKPALWGEAEEKLTQNSYLESNSFKNTLSSNKIGEIAKIGAYASIVGLAGIYATEVFAVAPAEALENFAKASFSPFVKVLQDYRPAPIAIGSIGAAAIGGGDGRERAEKALKGGALGAMVVLGALAIMPAPV